MSDQPAVGSPKESDSASISNHGTIAPPMKEGTWGPAPIHTAVLRELHGRGVFMNFMRERIEELAPGGGGGES